MPEAQLDRFLMKLHVDYPDRASELAMLDLADAWSDRPDEAETPPSAARPTSGRLRLEAPGRPGRPLDQGICRRPGPGDPRPGRPYGLDLAPLIELGASPRPRSR